MNIKDQIVEWLNTYVSEARLEGFVVGISGGIDSAVTSALCAETKYPLLALSMPIHQDSTLHRRSQLQQTWLSARYEKVLCKNVDLSDTFDVFRGAVDSSERGYANSKARLRMTTLYALAAPYRFLVAGTGNKVEDFGVGFFTKYGDGGVDLSPIADLTKTEVYELAKQLGIPQEIQDAAPTDGLWDDGREDEEQLGAIYSELEWAMQYNTGEPVNDRQAAVLNIYNKHREVNLHKMVPLPVCKIKRN